MNICVLIPAYNEVKTIGPLAASLRAKDLDVIVIDDGSTDGTAAAAKEGGALVISHADKQGKGACLREGFGHALKHDYDGVITMDGDGQHDVGDILKFLAAARDHKVSIVTGNRMINPKCMPFVRYCTNRVMSWMISRVCRQSIPDTQCGYRYIGCDILRVLDLSCNDFEIETEILIKACKKGFKVTDVPVKTIYRNEESQIHPYKDTIRFFAYLIKEVFPPRG